MATILVGDRQDQPCHLVCATKRLDSWEHQYYMQSTMQISVKLHIIVLLCVINQWLCGLLRDLMFLETKEQNDAILRNAPLFPFSFGRRPPSASTWHFLFLRGTSTTVRVVHHRGNPTRLIVDRHKVSLFFSFSFVLWDEENDFPRPQGVSDHPSSCQQDPYLFLFEDFERHSSGISCVCHVKCAQSRWNGDSCPRMTKEKETTQATETETERQRNNREICTQKPVPIKNSPTNWLDWNRRIFGSTLYSIIYDHVDLQHIRKVQGPKPRRGSNKK